MDLAQIEELIKILEESDTEELVVQEGESTIRIRKRPKQEPSATAPRPSVEPAEQPVIAMDVTPTESVIRAPMVGIFHTIDGLSKVGAQVEEGQVVGSIESMKLLNDVIADMSGVVTEVLVEDGTPVEYGQPLCRIELESAKV